MLPLVIINPGSAGGSTKRKWPSLAADLRAHFGPFKAAFTKAPGDGIALAERFASDGTEFIIACGGDGTANEVANGILRSRSNCEFGILPSGTGGDFRRTLGIPSEPREAARALKDGKTRQIDVGKVSFIDNDGNAGERYFLNVSSFGLAASIIERVKGAASLNWLPLDSLRGRASFALSTLQEVAGLNTTAVTISIDGGEAGSIRTANFCVANARYFGGGMLIAPDAKLSDGLFDIVNVGDLKTAKIILNSYTLYTGSHLDLPEVHTKLARRISARPQNEDAIVNIEIDGELLGRLPAEYEIVPGALRVRVPSQ